MGNEKPKKKPEEERTKVNGKAVALTVQGLKISEREYLREVGEIRTA